MACAGVAGIPALGLQYYPAINHRKGGEREERERKRGKQG